LLVNKYNGELEPQIKIADFGLSRDFASTYMTGTLGTYVKIYFICSIGWLPRFLTISPIH
jgi:hypothetical protein